MRIVLAPEGSRGDVQPLVLLGEWLAERGHDVLVVGAPEGASLAEGRPLTYRPTAKSARAMLEQLDQQVGAARPVELLRAARHFVGETIRNQFAELSEACHDADLLIGGGLQAAGPSVAALAGIPYRYVVYCPVLLPSKREPALLFRSQSLPGWVNRVGHWATRTFFRRALVGPLSEARHAHGLGRVGPILPHLLTDEPWLACDPDLAPPPGDTPIRSRPIGWLAPREGAALPAKLEAFLDAGPPPLYAGFGSMTDSAAEATTACLLEAAEAAGLRVVLSRGWAGLGDGPTNDRVFVADPLCHARLFPRVAAVLHHGGAGTTHAAARAGVPQLVVPHLADQFYWAQRLRVQGALAGECWRRDLSVEALVPALRALSDNELLRGRAAALGQRVRANIASADDSRAAALGDVR